MRIHDLNCGCCVRHWANLEPCCTLARVSGSCRRECLEATLSELGCVAVAYAQARNNISLTNCATLNEGLLTKCTEDLEERAWERKGEMRIHDRNCVRSVQQLPNFQPCRT